jgi:hypothetical protein
VALKDVRAVLRRSDDAYYVVEMRDAAGAPTRRVHFSLVGALNADPALRLLWRPVRPEDRRSGAVDDDVLYVVPS